MARMGAMPVPGPIMIMGVIGSRGVTNVERFTNTRHVGQGDLDLRVSEPEKPLVKPPPLSHRNKLAYRQDVFQSHP